MAEDELEDFVSMIARARVSNEVESALNNMSSSFKREDDFCKAAEEGRVDDVQRYLSEGFSPNSSSDFDYTHISALERAVMTQQDAVVGMLFEARADPMLNKFVGAFTTMAAALGGAEALEFVPGFPGPGEDGTEAKPVPGFPGLFLCLEDSYDEIDDWSHPDEDVSYQRTRRCLKRYRGRDNWERFRRGYEMRCVAMFWLGIAMMTSHAEDGPGRARDRVAFIEELS